MNNNSTPQICSPVTIIIRLFVSNNFRPSPSVLSFQLAPCTADDKDKQFVFVEVTVAIDSSKVQQWL